MNCPQISKEHDVVFNVVIDYCAGALDASRAAEFELHIAQCGACTEMVAAQRQVWESLDRLGHVDSPEVSHDFDARLYARIAQEAAAPAWRQWLRRILQPATPVAAWKPAVSMAALCAMLAVALVVRAPQSPANTVLLDGHAGRADQVDIEQVANMLDELDLLMPASQAPPSVM